MALYQIVDSILIAPYRLPAYPVLGYLLGTWVLGLLAVLVGELTLSLVFRVNRRHIEGLNSRLSHMKQLSQKALEAGDEGSYKACNRQANDAFGQLFFNKFGFAAASYWPVFFALAWMQERFSDVDLPIPGTGLEVGYLVTFLICYVAARIVFGKVRHRLPYFKGVHSTLKAYERT